MKVVSLPSSPQFAVLLVLCAETLIYSSASWAKQMFQVVGPEGVTVFRLFFSSLALCVFARPWAVPVPRAERRAHLFFGLGLGGMFLFSYSAIRYVPLGISVGIQMLGPLGIALFTSRRRVDFLWIAAAVAGLWLLLRLDAVTRVPDLRGVGHAFAAALCWAAYIWFGKVACARDCFSAVARAMFIGGVATLPVALHSAGTALFTPTAMILGFVLALTSAAIPCSLEMLALKAVPPRVYGTLMSLAPAIAAIVGMLVLNEMLTAGQWAGLGCIIFASAGVSVAATAEPEGRR